ncbi:10506_t:CDS:2 [Cetraspora pellucida]|uniref:10506_t:CDS:1 n=1 Tax=Cetraspora pellucida TaxID=1433469 RepID=A0A9N9GGG9_9GLOM|nr:10506_t:CDS:2 [Cetraspora pellucida]
MGSTIFVNIIIKFDDTTNLEKRFEYELPKGANFDVIRSILMRKGVGRKEGEQIPSAEEIIRNLTDILHVDNDNK